MKAGEQPELLLQLGNSKVKLQANGNDAINAVKWPLRFLISSLAVLLLCLGTAGYFSLPVAAVKLMKLF